MTDLSPERQRELLAAIGHTLKPAVVNGVPAWRMVNNGTPTIVCLPAPIDLATEGLWRLHGNEALAHDWHAQAARIAALEAENAALRARAGGGGWEAVEAEPIYIPTDDEDA